MSYFCCIKDSQFVCLYKLKRQSPSLGLNYIFKIHINSVFLHLVKKFMKHLFYTLLLFVSLSACSEYQKALKSEDISTKFKLGEQLYNEGKFSKANKLFVQIVPNYRGKPQAEKLMYLYANTFYEMKDNYVAGYQFERFATSYPKSEKVEEALYKSAESYSRLSRVFSKDQTETNEALAKLQNFINVYPNSQYIDKANALVKDLQYKLEKKAFSTAKQYNTIGDYKASISSFDNFIIDFPGTSFREEALYYRYNSAYLLGTKSVERKKKERLETAKSYYNAFKKAYPESKFIKDSDDLVKEIDKELEQYSTKS